MQCIFKEYKNTTFLKRYKSNKVYTIEEIQSERSRVEQKSTPSAFCTPSTVKNTKEFKSLMAFHNKSAKRVLMSTPGSTSAFVFDVTDEHFWTPVKLASQTSPIVMKRSLLIAIWLPLICRKNCDFVVLDNALKTTKSANLRTS